MNYLDINKVHPGDLPVGILPLCSGETKTSINLG